MVQDIRILLVRLLQFIDCLPVFLLMECGHTGELVPEPDLEFVLPRLLPFPEPVRLRLRSREIPLCEVYPRDVVVVDKRGVFLHLFCERRFLNQRKRCLEFREGLIGLSLLKENIPHESIIR